MLRGLKQTLGAAGPRDPTETETELCFNVSYGDTDQQWTFLQALLLEEVAINPTIETPKLI